MNNIIEHGDEHQFANGQSPRDLRDNPDATQHDLEDLRERADSRGLTLSATVSEAVRSYLGHERHGGKAR